MARPIAKLKLGYFPLPIKEAQNIRTLLLTTAPYAAIDPCVGDGAAKRPICEPIVYVAAAGPRGAPCRGR